MTHLIRLEDEQIEILQTLVSRRIHDELDNFGIREEHDSLDYIDLANIVKDLGELLKALSDPEEKKLCMDPVILPGMINPEDPLPKPEGKKKPGRPPKIKLSGPSCSTCSKALVAEHGRFTCKIDCESKTGMDYCGKYAEGTPYGSER